MRSIQSRFRRVQKKSPHLADYPCLVEAVTGQDFSRRRIYTHFNTLVSKDDYDASDTNVLVRYLHQVSKVPEECTFLEKNPNRALKMTGGGYGVMTVLQSPLLIEK